MRASILAAMLICAAAFAISSGVDGDSAADPSLKIVIIRHGEKPDDGDNLTCAGMDRALKLPAVLYNKFKTPNHTYVPSLDCGKSTNHSRMFQTVTPFAAKYNLKINSEFDEKDVTGAAGNVLKKKGTVLMVWEHSNIPPLAKALGIAEPKAWGKTDFDSIWIITFADGAAKITYDTEGITPATDCPY